MAGCCVAFGGGCSVSWSIIALRLQLSLQQKQDCVRLDPPGVCLDLPTLSLCSLKFRVGVLHRLSARIDGFLKASRKASTLGPHGLDALVKKRLLVFPKFGMREIKLIAQVFA
jgi:hypothetical protein